jgi:hypothetical protein
LDSRDKRLDIESSAFDIIVYDKKGESYRQVNKIEWPEITETIYSIDLLNANRSTYVKAKLLITRQDESQAVIEHGSLYDRDGTLLYGFYYSELNRIADRWTRRKIPLQSIKKIVLGSTRLMINPETRNLFPPDYRFDPYTGAPLAETALKED